MDLLSGPYSAIRPAHAARTGARGQMQQVRRRFMGGGVWARSGAASIGTGVMTVSHEVRTNASFSAAEGPPIVPRCAGHRRDGPELVGPQHPETTSAFSAFSAAGARGAGRGAGAGGVNAARLPPLVEPGALAPALAAGGLLVVDLRKPEHYRQAHLPGAVWLDYARLVSGERPAPGRLPAAARLSAAFSAIGFEPGAQVVAYDDEGGGHAARLLWTLHVLGHPGGSLLNGGFPGWVERGLPTTARAPAIAPSRYRAAPTGEAVAETACVQARIGDPEVVLLDARSPAEYAGRDRRALRGGHIPGAVNLHWIDTMDLARQRRLRPEPELREMLEARGITPDKEVIAYCQTHHRSSHSYLMLKSLGYPRVRGYPGSWAEWGNREDLPIESS